MPTTPRCAAGGIWIWAPTSCCSRLDPPVALPALPAGPDRGGALGAATGPTLARLRGRVRLVGPAHRQDHDHPAAADLVGDRRQHRRTGRGRAGRHPPVERAAADRGRRGQLPQGPPVPDRGCRPRPVRPGRVVRRGQERGHPGSVLRPARRGRIRAATGGQHGSGCGVQEGHRHQSTAGPPVRRSLHLIALPTRRSTRPAAGPGTSSGTRPGRPPSWPVRNVAAGPLPAARRLHETRPAGSSTAVGRS